MSPQHLQLAQENFGGFLVVPPLLQMFAMFFVF